MRFLSRKKLAVVATVATVGLGAGVAFAYWTTTGTGTGTASNGTSSAITIVGTAATALYPSTTSTVTFTAANPGTGNQSISNIHLVGVLAYPTPSDRTAGTNVISGCGGATNLLDLDFSMPDVTVSPTGDGDIAHGATAQALTATGTLTMNDLSTSQNACKAAYLALTFTTT